ncbi:putative mannose-1-phosphate guanyltransferase [Scheffersomyces xylosifermentans]|uniref:putative mannose-1-phosphate guanyltransferase n=1 Tax=Scheffersomyces xylosifermentans TaxID=1304137 RepID=UPI00315C7E8E
MTIKAVILVGGETTGTRFRPLSMESPKVLFPICGKPLISHIVDNLVSQLSDVEPLEILLLGFFKDPSKFDDYVNSARKEHPSVKKIKYLSEPHSMGTAGGLYYFRDEIFGDTSCEKILVIHGDVVCNYPFKQLIEFYDSEKSSAVILGIDPVLLMNNFQNTKQIQNQSSYLTYDKDKIFNLYGTIFADKDSNEVVHYIEKPTSKPSNLTNETSYNILLNGGVYVFNRDVLSELETAHVRLEDPATHFEFHDDLEEDDQDIKSISLELDILRSLPSTPNTKFSTFKSNSYWYQLKTPISALLANNFFLEQKLQKDSKALQTPSVNIVPPVLSLGTCLDVSQNYKIGPNVSIGKNVIIGNGVRITNSIIADNVTIGDNSFVSNAIVSEGVKIGKWCRIEGTITKTTISNDHAGISDGYFKLINNIVILGKNTVVQNQCFVYNSIVLPHKEIKSDIKYEIVM